MFATSDRVFDVVFLLDAVLAGFADDDVFWICGGMAGDVDFLEYQDEHELELEAVVSEQSCVNASGRTLTSKAVHSCPPMAQQIT